MAIDADDLEALAAEFVLGTLDVNERRAAEARMASDPSFRAEVAAWEKQLQPLADGIAPVAVPPAIFAHIEERVAGEPKLRARTGGNVVALRRQLRTWRIGAGIATAAAAALLAVVVTDATRSRPTEFVAMLTPDGGKPAFVLTVDTAKNTLSIRRVADAAPPDKSYELWAVEPGQNPKSLGVVDQASFTRPLPYSPKDLVFAISLEPRGGSPTGVATGPIVFSGPLLKQ
ncbi:MAG TPA: anti-sigma factor [Bauldia sp.]|nr:anti-sigma factor [Bauldia sp.]